MSDLTQEHLAVHSRFDYWAITVYGRPFQVVRLRLCNRFMRVLQPPRASSQVWAVAFSLATTKAISKFDFFSPVTEMFQFTEYTFTACAGSKTIKSKGFPHSEIFGW